MFVYWLFFYLATEDGCKHCPPRWILLNSVCYFFSLSNNAGYKTWQKAREFCQMHGGDLAVIDSKDKEVDNQHSIHVSFQSCSWRLFVYVCVFLFFFKILSVILIFQNSTVNHLRTFEKHVNANKGFWIGLNDYEEKGTWKWLDGRTMIEG